MGRRRSGGTERPALRYLKMRAWCSSSCHCAAVNGVHIAAVDGGGTLMVFIFIYLFMRKRENEGESERGR